MARQIINMVDFLEIMDPEVVDFALEQFQATEMQNEMVVSNYDDEGYCTFEYLGGEFFEFTGTAK